LGCKKLIADQNFFRHPEPDRQMVIPLFPHGVVRQGNDRIGKTHINFTFLRLPKVTEQGFSRHINLQPVVCCLEGTLPGFGIYIILYKTQRGKRQAKKT